MKPAWPKASSKRVARSLEAHAVLALSVSVLIYILVVTGTLSVFNAEFQRWEQPDVPEMAMISAESAERAALAVFRSEEEPSTHLFINYPTPDLPRTVITTDTQAFFVDADGVIADKEHFPWTQFLLDLHYYLHLPHVLGLTVVGAMGVFLLGLSLSGFLAHPRIFRDAFTFRRGGGRIGLADLHNRLSVWTAPFHISNALTGAMLGLASVLALAIGTAHYDGDPAAVYAPVFGEEPTLTDQSGILAIAASIVDFEQRFPDLDIIHVIVHDPMTDSQHIQLIAEHPTRLIFGDYYLYDAAGTYLGNTGISDGSVGQQIAGSVYNVHFGNWGGLPVKIAYGIFGLVLSIIIASGLAMYFGKRRDKGRAAPKLEGAWEGVVWGTPFMLAVTLMAAQLGATGLLAPLFWLGLIVLAIGGSALRKRMVRTYLSSASSIVVVSIVAGHLVTFGGQGLLAGTIPGLALCVVAFGVLLSSAVMALSRAGEPA